MTRIVSALVLVLAIGGRPNAAQVRAEDTGTHGPKHGSLVLQGGVGLYRDVASRFVSLAGGPSSHIVLIPTASVGDAGPPGMTAHLATRMKADWGVSDVTVLHSLDRDTSNSDRFVEPLQHASGVWMLGGFPENLIRSYLGTKTERAIRDLLERGGVVGGESAGAMLQASWLDVSDPQDFTPDVLAIIAAHGPAGFNLLTHAAIFPHFDTRGPHDAVQFIRGHPEQLGIGIDEETALIVTGDRAEVIGLRTVSMFDGAARATDRPLILHGGDHYDLAARK
jgi:cyanophycinase